MNIKDFHEKYGYFASIAKSDDEITITFPETTLYDTLDSQELKVKYSIHNNKITKTVNEKVVEVDVPANSERIILTLDIKRIFKQRGIKDELCKFFVDDIEIKGVSFFGEFLPQPSSISLETEMLNNIESEGEIFAEKLKELEI